MANNRRITPTHRSPTPPRPLSREAIVDAAIALVEREGAEVLSMRRLGAELGIEAMSLYHYFQGREELLGAIGERMLAPLDELDVESDWHSACTRFAGAVRRIAVAQPATFRLLGLQPLDSPRSLRPVERLLGALVADGFEPAEALALYRAVTGYARGYALAEVTGFTVDAADPRRRAVLRALPNEEFPILRGRAAELARLDPNLAFERGLRALLDGFPSPDGSAT